MYGNFIDSVSDDHAQAILVDFQSVGDHILYLWRKGQGSELLYGKPVEQREPGEKVEPSSISSSALHARQSRASFSSPRSLTTASAWATSTCRIRAKSCR